MHGPNAEYTCLYKWIRSRTLNSKRGGTNMAQITLYIDDALQARLRESSARLRVSQSQFVADLIRQAVDDRWPAEVLALAGSVPDFPDTQALRTTDTADVPRVL